MTSSDQSLLERLARTLRAQHQVSLSPEPARLAVSERETSVTVAVTTAEGSDGPVRKFWNSATGRVYGSEMDLRLVAERVRIEVTEPARRALIAAHELLLKHYPNRSGWCVPCGVELPCQVVTEQVKVMDSYRHLDQLDGMKAEEGAHACRDWIYPYRC